jgi:cation diffusion facilitator CzcD-associated flavoprotein CzcO
LEQIDVLIVGAGISGIGAACHLSTRCPGKSYAVLEARDAIGGTWDLFRYPGIRSDSDMYTMGYVFKPWLGDKALADGGSIRHYIEEAAREYGVEQHIRTARRAVAARWSSNDARWTVDVRHSDSDDLSQIQCRFLFLCTGYYDYEHPHDPDFDGSENFRGQIVHPQFWPQDLDYRNKRVVVIGSGATAVTIVPSMANHTASITMLQRSPTYMMSVPGEDPLSRFLRRFLSQSVAFQLTRWKNILLGMLVYQLCQRRPEWAKKILMKGVKSFLGEDEELLRHFTPSYKPWDQRLCLVPDGDLFHAVKEGKATIVTDHIDRFTESGILLKSGRELPADLVVKATGLKIKLVDNMDIRVDGERVRIPERMLYQGMMIGDVPNFAFTIGYTNATWTLKSDLVGAFVSRLLNYMDEQGYRTCRPQMPPGLDDLTPMMDFTSGYIVRARDELPKEGTKAPWKMYQNYVLDRIQLSRGSLEDGVMQFGR